ncbi:MAG: hypothetical protein N2484_03720 [Clostridia bacterium]|nr:hypothetical protein [Clostridia bacterium]
MNFLKILAFLFLAAGFGIVFAARTIVKKYHLDQKSKCDFENEMTGEELQQYKVNKATVNVKMMGMLVALPGLILIVVLFK